MSSNILSNQFNEVNVSAELMVLSKSKYFLHMPYIQIKNIQYLESKLSPWWASGEKLEK